MANIQALKNLQTATNPAGTTNPRRTLNPKRTVNLKGATHPQSAINTKSAVRSADAVSPTGVNIPTDMSIPAGVSNPTGASHPPDSFNGFLPSRASLLSFLCLTIMLTATLITMLTVMFISPQSAQAAPPKRFEIQTFTLAVTDNMLGIDLALTLDNEDGLYNLLKDGAVVELGIDLSIERKREWWSNADIASLRYTSVIRHDPLTREFYLTMPNADQPLKDRNLTRLLTNSWQKLSLPLIPLSLIELEGRNQTYVISCSASLNHIETPPWLAQNSVFWSAEIIPPVSISLEYVYQ